MHHTDTYNVRNLFSEIREHATKTQALVRNPEQSHGVVCDVFFARWMLRKPHGRRVASKSLRYLLDPHTKFLQKIGPTHRTGSRQ